MPVSVAMDGLKGEPQSDRIGVPIDELRLLKPRCKCAFGHSSGFRCVGVRIDRSGIMSGWFCGVSSTMLGIQ